MPVVAVRSVERDVPVELQAIGRVEASTRVTVRPRVQGQLEAVHFTEGDEVQAGQLLFTLDARPFEVALAAAEANLARNQALATDAALEAERVADLFSRGTAGERELTAAQAQAAAQAATVRADEAAVAQARLQLEYCRITAPISGRTGDLLAHPGSIVRENETDLVVIHQIDPVHVGFSVAEQHLASIKEARSRGAAPVTVELPSRMQETSARVTGRLDFIDNTVDPTTGMVRLKATFENQDRALWPGLFVRVTLTLSTRTGAVLVPAEAVRLSQQGSFVFVIGEDQTVSMRPVLTGERPGSEVVIRSGLKAAELVVTDGHLRLVPGARVAVREAEPHVAGTALQP